MVKRPLTLRPALDAPPGSGPVAWWKFDETQGADVPDAAGKRGPAAVRGAARWGPGHVGGALELDGRSFVDCGDHPGYDFRDGLAVALWVKPRGSRQSPQTLIAKGDSTWSLRSVGAHGDIVFEVSGPQTTGTDRKKQPQARSRRALDDGQWHHVVGTYDGQRVALYIDGALEDSVTASGPLGLSTEPIWIGNNSVETGEPFAGWLDDVRLYRHGLGEPEIKALHQGTAVAAATPTSPSSP